MSTTDADEGTLPRAIAVTTSREVGNRYLGALAMLYKRYALHSIVANRDGTHTHTFLLRDMAEPGERAEQEAGEGVGTDADTP